MKKSAIVISENEEFYRALKRASKAIADIEVERYPGQLKEKNKVVIYSSNGGDFSFWYCGEFRSKKKALNPLIVISHEDSDAFLKQHPVFKTYSDEHAYFQIPFCLESLFDKISMLKPIYDQTTRGLMVKDFCGDYEYKLVTHDLKIIKGDKQATIDNLSRVRDFYLSKGDKVITKTIDEKIKEIQNGSDDWSQIALDIKNYLIERLPKKL